MGNRRSVFWLVIACFILGGCASSTDERLAVLESSMMTQEILDLRVAAVEDRLTLVERGLGSLGARVDGMEAQKTGKNSRKPAKQPAPPKKPVSPAPVAPEKNTPPPVSPTPPPPAPPAPPVEKQPAPTPPVNNGQGAKNSPVGDAANGQTAPQYDPESEFSPFVVPNDQFGDFGASYTGKTDNGQVKQDQPGQLPVAPGQSGQPSQPAPSQTSNQPTPPPPATTTTTTTTTTSPVPPPPPVPPAVKKDAPIAGEKAAYDKALGAYNSKRYAEGEKLFSQFLQTYPAGKLAPNAGYWLGECYYSQRKFDSAILAFKNVVGKFPKHEKAAASLLKAGYSYALLGDKDNARFYIQMLIDDFPNSQTAATGRKKLQSLGP